MNHSSRSDALCTTPSFQPRRLCSNAALLGAFALAAGCSSGKLPGGSEVIGQTEEAVQSSSSVLVNQLGYAKGAQKIGVVVSASSTPGTIEIVNSSGAVVWTGGTTVVKNPDVNSGDKVHHADFSGFSTSGSGYKLKVTIGGTASLSEPFDLADDLYNPATGKALIKGALKYFHWKRDGAYTVAADTTYNLAGHGSSHLGDSARGAHVDTVNGGTSPWSTVTFDVQGGHLDAGDFSKYVESDTAKAFYLANLFERTKGNGDPNGVKIETLDLGFNDGGLPDVLAEIAWGVRAVRGMLPSPTVHKTGTDLSTDCPQNPDGVTPSNTVVPCKWLAGNKLAGDAWAQWVNIDADTATDRYVAGPSTSATYSVARNLAQISRIVRPYGAASTIIGLDGVSNLSASAYADKLWETAKEAFGRASGKHPDYADYTGKGANVRESDLKPKQQNGFNNGSGFYGDNDSWDDKHAAEVEMYLTACERGDTAAVAKYKALVTANASYKQAGPCDWGSEVPLGDPVGEERGCALLSLLTSAETLCTGANALPVADLTTMKNNLYAYADGIVANMNGQNYPFYVADGGQVPWGSNAAQASSVVMLTVAYEKSGNKNYLKAANRLMDYILGVNPMKMSYVIGFGDAAETVTHDRAMKATGKYVHGTVVGGPHNLDANFAALATYWGGGPGIDDTDTPDSGPVLKHMAVVADPANSWESQENAVNWNAALANAVWGLAIHNDELGCSVNADCDDDNACTTDTCTAGTCSNTMSTACNDNRACTVDSCNPATGACTNNASACCSSDGNCSDGTACTEDVCGTNELCTNPWRTVCTTTSTTTALTRALVAASSEENTTNTAAKAIDADTTSTRWASAFNDNEWIRVDMGAKRYVNRVVLVWEAAYSTAYDVEVADSANGPWTKIYGTTAGNGGTDDLTSAVGLTPSSGRYVRMFGKTRATGYGHSLYDFSVYGHAGTATSTCGDNSCDGTENTSCSGDCGTSSTSCGDGSCNGTETCSTCASDCGACTSCGDGSCSGSETCSSCASDCGACAPTCGDGACNGSETCSACSSDCGACPPACGDGTCNGTETCSSCASDCGTCPTASYTSVNINSQSGTTTESGGTITVEGEGSDIYGTTDEFRFVYKAFTGDGEMVAKVTSVENTNTWAKAAVMMRQFLTGGSKYALLMQAPDKKLQFQYRTTDNQSIGSGQQANVSSYASWAFLKMRRSGNSFSAFYSSDGTNWTQLGTTQTIDMGTGTVYGGLAVCSHVNDSLCTATFSNVSWPGAPACNCADDGNPCTVDACDANNVCQHTAGNAGGVCRPAAAGGCDMAETCSGTSTVCPADNFMPAITVCRPANTAGCDVAETCSGTSAACPADGFAAANVVCRAAAGACDVAEACNGTSSSCPGNAYQPNNTACNDSSACTTSDVCTNGVCGGSAVNCDDGNVCTTDACNPATGCANTNNTGSCADDGNSCTNDVCSGGVCTHPAAASGASCNDGNASTCSDVCNASAVCGGSTCASCTPTTANCEYQMASGQVVVEAEHYFAKSTTGVTTGDSWNLVSGVSQASGNQCMEVGPENNSMWTSNVSTTSPRLDFKVNFTTSGQFYVHIKADSTGGSGNADSCWVGVDGTTNASYVDIADAPNTYGWTTFNLGSIASGMKTINFWAREDGFRLDKLVISQSVTAPTGMGPAESTLN
jgi:endoglucanase